jgi:hypothetical protein
MHVRRRGEFSMMRVIQENPLAVADPDQSGGIDSDWRIRGKAVSGRSSLTPTIGNGCCVCRVLTGRYTRNCHDAAF